MTEPVLNIRPPYVRGPFELDKLVEIHRKLSIHPVRRYEFGTRARVLNSILKLERE